MRNKVAKRIRSEMIGAPANKIRAAKREYVRKRGGQNPKLRVGHFLKIQTNDNPLYPKYSLLYRSVNPDPSNP